METPPLETERLLLHPMNEEDIPFVFKLFSRNETNKYSEYPDLKNMKEAEELYEKFIKPGSENHFRLLIKLKENGEPIGTIGLYNFTIIHMRAELGYDLLKEYWGNEYMTEAVKALIDYGFGRLGLVRIEASVDSENVASIMVLERTGFQLEGNMRERNFYKGKFHDERFYGLL